MDFLAVGCIIGAQLVASGYFYGKLKATLNGTGKLVEKNAQQITILHNRQSKHTEDYHTTKGSV